MNGPRIAALSMYDRPETAAANDRLWAGIRAAFGSGPPALTRAGDPWDIWRSPRLLLAQTCGYPYRARLHGRVALVGTPDPGLPDCPPGHYFSVFIARASDAALPVRAFAGRRFAYNEALSQSGWAAPRCHAAQQGFTFTNLLCSGSHRASAQAVAEGRADCAALDAVSWEMMRRWDDFARGLVVLERTAPTPGLPLISARGADTETLAKAVAQAIDALPRQDRDTLMVRALVPIEAERYLEVATPPGPGEAGEDSAFS